MILSCSSLFLFLVLLCSFPKLVVCIYEDQIDEFDWLKIQIGHVLQMERTFSTFLVRTPTALAALNSTSGHLVWRRVFSEKEGLQKMVLCENGKRVVIALATSIQMWNVETGTMAWSVPGKGVLTSMKKVGVLVHAKDTLRMISLNTGKVAWTYQGTGNIASVLAQTSRNTVTVLIPNQETNTSMVVQLDASTGKVSKEYSISSCNTVLLLTSSAAPVVVSLEKNTLQVYSRSGSTMESTKKVDGNVLITGEKGMLFVENTTSRTAFRVDSVSEIIELGTYDNTCGTVLHGTRTLVGKMKDTEKGMEKLELFESADQVLVTMEMETVDTSLRNEHGLIQQVFPLVDEINTESLSVSALVVWSDHAVGYVSSGKLQWIREEGLASIVQSEWVAPSDVHREETEGVVKIPSYSEALVLQYKSLLQLWKTLSFSKLALLWKSDNNDYFFGFSKLLIVLTTPGKLYALDSQTGSILWTRYLGAEKQLQLIVTRDHPGLGVGPELLLFDITEKETIYIDADHGLDMEKASYATSFSHLVMLPKHALAVEESSTSSSSERVVALVDTSLTVHLFPNTKESLSEFKRHVKSLYFHSLNDNVVNGYKFQKKNDVYMAVETWRIVLPVNEMVVTTAHTKASEIDSPVTITGDDSLLIKYLNPHLYTIVTLNEEDSMLNILVIDTVSGRIIQRSEHEHGVGPVHVQMVENWILYSFWNMNEMRTELVSMVLYEGAIARTGLHLWKRPTWVTSMSSFTATAPIILQKSFIFPTPVQVNNMK